MEVGIFRCALLCGLKLYKYTTIPTSEGLFHVYYHSYLRGLVSIHECPTIIASIPSILVGSWHGLGSRPLGLRPETRSTA